MACLPYVAWVSDTGELEAASLSQMLRSLYSPFSQCIFLSSWKPRAGLCCCSLEKLKVPFVICIRLVYFLCVCICNITELSIHALCSSAKDCKCWTWLFLSAEATFYLLCDPFHSKDNATKTRFPVVVCVQILRDLWPFPVPTYILGND